MRIVYIFNSMTHKGGTERILCDKMNYLADVLGHEVTFVSFEQGMHANFFHLSDKVRHIDLDTRFFTISSLPLWKRAFRYYLLRKLFRDRLRDTLAPLHPDVVVIPTYLYALQECVLRLPYPVVIEAHVSNYGILKCLEECHSPLVGKILKLYATHCLGKAKRASRIVLLTDNARKDWAGFRNLEVIPNVVTRYPSDIPDTRHRPKRIISVGRLQSQKGFDMLVEAWSALFRRHPDWTLDIYGEGEERTRLQTMTDRYGMEQSMHLKGISDDIYEEYMGSAFYVMSSRYEGWGLVLVEGMSCGLPCVSFDCPHGPSDIITDGKDGFLVESGNVSMLAEKMERLINDAELRQDMARNAREKSAQFKKEKIMHRWETLFESVAEGR